MIKALRTAYRARRYRRALTSIGVNMATLGYPLVDLSDAEIEAGAARIGKAIASAGITVSEATDRMLRIAAAAQ